MRFERTKRALAIFLLIANVMLLAVFINARNSGKSSASFYKEAREALAGKGIAVSDEYISFADRKSYVYELPADSSYYERAAARLAFGEMPDYSFDTPDGERFGFADGASAVFFERIGFCYTANDDDETVGYLSIANGERELVALLPSSAEQLPRAAHELTEQLSGNSDATRTEQQLHAEISSAYYSPEDKLYIVNYQQYVGNAPVISNEATAVIVGEECAAIYGKWCFADKLTFVEAQICDYVNILFSARSIVSASEKPMLNVGGISDIYLVYYSGTTGALFLIPGENVVYDGGYCYINAIDGNEYTN